MILEKIDKQSIEIDQLPDSEEAIQTMIAEQELLITEQEKNRPEILSLLQRGKDLMRDPNCPIFVKDEVAALEQKWNNCCRKSIVRLSDLNENGRVVIC